MREVDPRQGSARDWGEHGEMRGPGRDSGGQGECAHLGHLSPSNTFKFFIIKMVCHMLCACAPRHALGLESGSTSG